MNAFKIATLTLVLSAIAPSSSFGSACRIERKQACGQFVCNVYFEVVKDGQVIFRTPYESAAKAKLGDSVCSSDLVDSQQDDET